MPASLGGSVVDPSLLRQAADRGVTICFADLDGADGLWVPEERTVLVNRGLSEAQVADVIEHELAHVMIDDQHADLDAGRDVVVGRPPAQSARPLAVALSAVALLAVVGGVWFGVTRANAGDKQDRLAPNPPGPGLTAPQESASPTTTVIKTRLPDGRIVYRTVVVTQAAAVPSPTVADPAGTLRPAPVPPTQGVPSRPPPRSSVAPPPQQTSPPAPVQPSTNPPVPTTPDPTPTEAAPTSAASDGAGDPVGDGTGDGAGNPVGDAGGGGAVSPEPAGASAVVGDVSVEVSDPPTPVIDPSN